MADNADSSATVTQCAPPSGGAAQTQRVSVSLFGALQTYCRQRPLLVDVPAGASIAEVIELLGHRLGSGFIESVMETAQKKFGFCRIFVNGSQVGLEARLPVGSTAPKIELIVLTAFEGG